MPENKDCLLAAGLIAAGIIVVALLLRKDKGMTILRDAQGNITAILPIGEKMIVVENYKPELPESTLLQAQREIFR